MEVTNKIATLEVTLIALKVRTFLGCSFASHLPVRWHGKTYQDKPLSPAKVPLTTDKCLVAG